MLLMGNIPGITDIMPPFVQIFSMIPKNLDEFNSLTAVLSYNWALKMCPWPTMYNAYC